jgi:hypothetical protein
VAHRGRSQLTCDLRLARSGEDAQLDPRPAISECRCVRHASPGVFSVPVLMGNQGSAPTVAGDVTVDDAECPRMASCEIVAVGLGGPASLMTRASGRTCSRRAPRA